MTPDLEQFFSRTIAWMQQVIRWGSTPADEALFAACLSAAPRIVVGEDACDSAAGRALARLATRVLSRAFPGLQIQAGDGHLAAELEALATEPLGRRLHGSVPTAVLAIGAVARHRDLPISFIGTSGTVARLDSAPIETERNSYGPSALLAAAFGVSEVTKAFLRSSMAEYAGRWTAWDLEPTAKLRLVAGLSATEAATAPSTVDLRDTLVVSAGAVTHAMLAALLETPEVQGQLTVLDDQCADLTNGNRYLLLSAEAAMAGTPKVHQLATVATRESFRVLPRMRSYSPGYPPASLVLIGADRISARLDAQQDGHGCIVNGATEHDLVRISMHLAGRGACLGCINPAADIDLPGFAPTISFVSAATGAMLAGAAVEAVTGVRTAGAVLDYRALQPHRTGNIVRTCYGPSRTCALGHAIGSVAA